MAHFSVSSTNPILNGSLTYIAKKKNFPLQVISFLFLNSKTKQSFFSAEKENFKKLQNFIEEILNQGGNNFFSGLISFKLLCDILLVLEIKNQTRNRRTGNFIQKSTKGLDPCFFLNLNPGALISFSLENWFLVKNITKEKIFPVFEELFPFLNSNQVLYDYFLESTQDSKIIDLTGIYKANAPLIKKKKCHSTEKKRIMKLSFHTYRKIRSLENLVKTGLWFRDIRKIFNSVLEATSFSEQASRLIGFGKIDIISCLSIIENPKLFSKWARIWIKNCIQFRILFHTSFKRILDFNFLEKGNLKGKKLQKKINPLNINYHLLVGKSFFSKYFFYEHELKNLVSFWDQIDKISTGFSGINGSGKKINNDLSFLGDFCKSFCIFQENERDFYSSLGFFFSFDILKGFDNLKKIIEKIKSKKQEKCSEYKLIIMFVLVGTTIFSERFFSFLLKSMKLRYFSTFFLTGDWKMGKLLESLFFGVGCLFLGSKKFLAEKVYAHLEVCFRTFLTLNKERNLQKWKDFPFKIKNELDEYSTSRITGLLVFSFSFLNLTNFKKKSLKFSREVIFFLRYFGDNFFLDLKQKFFQLYILLSLGVLHFGKKKKSLLTSVQLNTIQNKKLRLILHFFTRICSLIGTSDLRLISFILKNLEAYSLRKTRRLQRFHSVLNRFKKVKEDPQFEKKLIPINDYEEKKTFYFIRLKVRIGILGLAIITLNDEETIPIIFRIFSFFFSNNDLEYSRISTLSFGLIFLSKPESWPVDFLIKLIGSKDWRTVKNAIFSLGLIGSGTNNSRINNSLKYLGNFYLSKIDFLKNRSGNFQKRSFLFGLKIRSIISTLRISQGLISSSGNFLTVTRFSQIQNFDFTKTASLLCIIQGFLNSGLIGLHSIPISIFLLLFLSEIKAVYSITKNLKIKSILIRLERPGSLKEKFELTPFNRNFSKKDFFNELNFFFCK